MESRRHPNTEGKQRSEKHTKHKSGVKETQVAMQREGKPDACWSWRDNRTEEGLTVEGKEEKSHTVFPVSIKQRTAGPSSTKSSHIEFKEEGRKVQVRRLAELSSRALAGFSGNLRESSIGFTELPLEPSLSRTLIEADELGCLSQALTVAAMLSAEIALRPIQRNAKDSKSKEQALQLPDGFCWGDHIQLLQIYESWDRADYDSDWCINHNLQGDRVPIDRFRAGETCTAWETAGMAEHGRGRLSSVGEVGTSNIERSGGSLEEGYDTKLECQNREARSGGSSESGAGCVQELRKHRIRRGGAQVRTGEIRVEKIDPAERGRVLVKEKVNP
ncbi:hypothetical protein KSP40_PGU001610 [Platanthera guangdongensis]|uniref:Uncharacterized protein n=1 Tax=Platanthera guangdongensis TaxID=2320717 RepID=A0ABR2LBP8_9ASPA